MFGGLKPGFRSLTTLKLVVNVVGEQFKSRKEQLRHRAVSLPQHGFLVVNTLMQSLFSFSEIGPTAKHVLVDDNFNLEKQCCLMCRNIYGLRRDLLLCDCECFRMSYTRGSDERINWSVAVD